MRCSTQVRVAGGCQAPRPPVVQFPEKLYTCLPRRNRSHAGDWLAFEMTQDNDPTADAPPNSGFVDGFTVLTVAAFLLTGGLLATVLRTRGQFVKIFADFKTELPLVTHVVQSAPFVWLVGTLFALNVAKEFLPVTRKTKAVCSTIAILAVLVLGALYLTSIFLPLTVLIEKLSR